jgi:hypothetical protein
MSKPVYPNKHRKKGPTSYSGGGVGIEIHEDRVSDDVPLESRPVEQVYGWIERAVGEALEAREEGDALRADEMDRFATYLLEGVLRRLGFDPHAVGGRLTA